MNLPPKRDLGGLSPDPEHLFQLAHRFFSMFVVTALNNHHGMIEMLFHCCGTECKLAMAAKCYQLSTVVRVIFSDLSDVPEFRDKFCKIESFFESTF